MNSQIGNGSLKLENQFHRQQFRENITIWKTESLQQLNN